MRSLLYSNGFIDTIVDIFDDDVAFHVSNYLVPEEKCTGNSIKYRIKAILEDKKNIYVGKTQEVDHIKGEYGESILLFIEGGNKYYYNEDNGSIFYWEDNYNLIIYNSDKKGLFIDTYRAIRQIMIGDLLNRGGIIIHSSSVYIGNKGYLFVGNKGAGKTTSLFQYLNSQRTDIYYGSNERTILVTKNGKLFMYGWPGTAFVGVGTIKSTIGLKALYDIHKRAGETATWLSLHELTDNEYVDRLIKMGDEAYDIKKKIWLTANEIAFITEKKIKNYGYLDKVIWPNLTVELTQNIRKVQKSLENDMITNIDFFGNWLGIRKHVKEDKSIIDKLAVVSQYEIMGENLVYRIDDIK